MNNIWQWYLKNTSIFLLWCAYCDILSLLIDPVYTNVFILTATVLAAMIFSLIETGHSLHITVEWEHESNDESI